MVSEERDEISSCDDMFVEHPVHQLRLKTAVPPLPNTGKWRPLEPILSSTPALPPPSALDINIHDNDLLAGANGGVSVHRESATSTKASAGAHADAHPQSVVDLKAAMVKRLDAHPMNRREWFPVLLPTNNWLGAWNLFILFGVLVITVWGPFDIAFVLVRLDTPAEIAAFALNHFLDLVFMMDIVVTFHVAYKDKHGNLVTDRRLVMRRYLHSTRLWWDVLSVLPVDLIQLLFWREYMGITKLLRLLRLLRVPRLMKFNRVWQSVQTKYAINYSDLQLFGFCAMICIFCHWLACGWYMVILLEDNQTCIEIDGGCCFNWLDCQTHFAYFNRGKVISRMYLLAVVWSSGQVLTVGAPIDAYTDWELFYQMVARMMSGIMYAYLIGAVCNVFAMKTKHQTAFFEDMDTLNEFLVTSRVDLKDQDLCQRLRVFFQFSSSIQDQGGHIMNRVSPGLKGQLAWRIHSDWLEQLALFKQLQHEMDQDKLQDFYVSVTSLLTSTVFAPWEILIEPHHPPDSLFVVQSGMVLAGRVRTAGDPFGEDCVTAWRRDMERNYQATAVSHGRVNMLKIPQLVDLMKRPKFKNECEVIFKQMKSAQIRTLMVFYTNLIKTILSEGNELQVILRRYRKALYWVKIEAMPELFRLVLIYYQKAFEEEFQQQVRIFMNETGEEYTLDNMLFWCLNDRNKMPRTSVLTNSQTIRDGLSRDKEAEEMQNIANLIRPPKINLHNDESLRMIGEAIISMSDRSQMEHGDEALCAFAMQGLASPKVMERVNSMKKTGSHLSPTSAEYTRYSLKDSQQPFGTPTASRSRFADQEAVEARLLGLEKQCSAIHDMMQQMCDKTPNSQP